MAENLAHRGLSITVVEMLKQVMPPLDPEMARPVQEHLEKHGVKVALGDAAAGFQSRNGQILVSTKSGAQPAGDLVILAIGVRPETHLAKLAGLELGERGGIRVDEQMRTTDPHIWAVGDAVEVRDTVTGQWVVYFSLDLRTARDAWRQMPFAGATRVSAECKAPRFVAYLVCKSRVPELPENSPARRLR